MLLLFSFSPTLTRDTTPQRTQRLVPMDRFPWDRRRPRLHAFAFLLFVALPTQGDNLCLLLAGRSTGVASREHAPLKEYCALVLSNVLKLKGIDGRRPVGQQVSPPLVTCAFSGKFLAGIGLLLHFRLLVFVGAWIFLVDRIGLRGGRV